MLTYAIPRMPAILIVQLGFQICDSKLFDKLRRTISVTLSYSILRHADVAFAFIIQNSSIT